MRASRIAAIAAAGVVPLLVGSLVAGAAWADAGAPEPEPSPAVTSGPAGESLTDAVPEESPESPADLAVELPVAEPAAGDPAVAEPAVEDAPVDSTSVVDFSSPQIAAGETLSVPFRVDAGATGLTVFVVGSPDVVATLQTPTGPLGFTRANRRDYLLLEPPPAGDYVLELANTGDAPAAVSYDFSVQRPGLQLAVTSNLGSPILQVNAIPRIAGVAQSGLDVRLRLSGPGGAESDHAMTEAGTTGNYSLTLTGLPVGGYTFVVWTERAGQRFEHAGWSTIAEAETTPPVVEYLTVPAAPNSRNWFARPNVDVTLRASDAGSGVWSISYALGAGALTTHYGTRVDLRLIEGVHTLRYQAADAQGNTSGLQTRTIRIDSTRPTVAVGAPLADATYALGEEVLADFDCTDLLSGIVDCVASVDAGQPIDTSVGGVYLFDVVATDGAGNLTERTISYRVGEPDVVAPTATISYRSAPASGWYLDRLPIRIDATDADSGVDRIEWVLDGVPGTGPGDSAAFMVEGPGEITLAFRAVDVAGNAGDWQEVVIPIDGIAPTIQVVAPAGPVHRGEALYADYACTDAHSGVVDCDGTVPDGALLSTYALGPQSFTVTARDAAGNVTTQTVRYEVVAVTQLDVLAQTGAVVAPVAGLAVLLIGGGVAVTRLRRRA